MTEDGEMWKAFRAHNQAEKAQRTRKNIQVILNLVNYGHIVRKLTEYHYRINNRLDLFPTNCRYHDIKTGKRGFYPH